MRKVINNPNDAEQNKKKWLGGGNPIVPRQFRMTEIHGESADQINIQATTAIKRMKGKMQLLYRRSEKRRDKVMNTKNHESKRKHQRKYWKICVNQIVRKRRNDHRRDQELKKCGN